MDWDRIADNWKQFSRKVKEKLGELTDNDLTRINGNREQLLLQERYGYAKDRARDRIDTWSETSVDSSITMGEPGTCRAFFALGR